MGKKKKKKRPTFQAFLCIASLNDLHASSIRNVRDLNCNCPTSMARQSCHILGSVAKDSMIQWCGKGLEGVSNGSDSQMPANTPGEKHETQPKNLTSFIGF